MALAQTELAKALGISQPTVSRLVGLGMPVTSAEDAARWRSANLNPELCKRAPGELLAELLAAAERQLAGGESVAALAPEIRAQLRQLPAARRAEIRMSPKMWDLLTEAVRRQLPAARRRELSPSEAAEMGAFWFEAATGKWRANP